MKEVIVLATVCIGLTACNKLQEYKCECTYVANNPGPSAGQPDIVEIRKVEAGKEATSPCDTATGHYSFEGYEGTCVVK